MMQVERRNKLRGKKQRIADRKSAKELMQGYEKVVESSDDMIAVVDQEYRYLHANHAYLDQRGLKREELLGLSVPEVLGEEAFESVVKEKLDECFQGKTVRYEMKQQYPKLGERDTLVSYFPIENSQGVNRAVCVIEDITERKRAEQALNDERHLLQTLMDNLPDVIYFKDRDSRFTLINMAHAKLFGLSDPAQAIGKTDFDFFAADHAQSAYNDEREIIKTGQPMVGKVEKETWPDGHVTWVSTTKMPLRDADGNIIGTFGVSRDITERKRAEEALNEERHLLYTLMDNLPDLIYFKDRESRFTRINLALAKKFDLDRPAQAVGKTDFDFLPAEHAEAFHRDDADLLRTGLPIVGKEEKGIWPDGHVTWVSTTKMLLRDSNGNNIGTFGVSRDITEHKAAEEALRASEERFRATFENAGIGVALVDMQGHPIKSNPALQQMLGYSEEELSRMAFTEYTHPDDRDLDWGLFSELVAGKREKYETEKRFLKKGGDVVWGQLTASLVKDRYGRPVCAVGMVQNITERKRAEEALRRSEASLAEGEKLTHTGSWTWNVSTGELFWSQETYRIFGFDPAKDRASVSDTFLARIHPEDRARIEAGLRNPQLQKVSEYRIVLPDGSIRHIHDIAHGVADAAGKVVERFGVACDITERRQAQQALRQSEERFRQIAETIDEVFWTADPQITKMFYVSPAYKRIWGRPVASLYEDPRSFLEAIYADDRERVLADLDVQKSGQSFDHEYRIVRPDGGVRWIWDRGFPVRNKAGQVVRYVGVAIDITERKRAEAEHVRLVTAIEQSAEAVMITTTSGEIEYVNPAFSRITGYSREEALGQNPRILKSGNQDPALYQQLWETILQGKDWHGELINRRKDGSLYHEQMNIAAVRAERGEVTHFIATKQDITARKELEQRFVQAQKMEAVGRLAGGVAHDFNNLLTVINGYAQILTQRSSPKDPRRGLFEEIQMAGEKAASLTRQLLAFSRRQVLEPRVLDLSSVLANTEKMLRRLIGEDIELATKLKPDLGRVKVDPGQIEQVIMNLAVNARDAMPQGGKFIIETANVEVDEDYALSHKPMTPGKYIMVSVSDTGCGMDCRGKMIMSGFSKVEMSC